MNEADITIYTTKDIQNIFRCGKSQAYKLMNTGGFPSIRIGGKILVEKIALEVWLEKNKGKNVAI